MDRLSVEPHIPTAALEGLSLPGCHRTAARGEARAPFTTNLPAAAILGSAPADRLCLDPGLPWGRGVRDRPFPVPPLPQAPPPAPRL